MYNKDESRTKQNAIEDFLHHEAVLLASNKKKYGNILRLSSKKKKNHQVNCI